DCGNGRVNLLGVLRYPCRPVCGAVCGAAVYLQYDEEACKLIASPLAHPGEGTSATASLAVYYLNGPTPAPLPYVRLEHVARNPAGSDTAQAHLQLSRALHQSLPPGYPVRPDRQRTYPVPPATAYGPCSQSLRHPHSAYPAPALQSQ